MRHCTPPGVDMESVKNSEGNILRTLVLINRTGGGGFLSDTEEPPERGTLGVRRWKEFGSRITNPNNVPYFFLVWITIEPPLIS